MGLAGPKALCWSLHGISTLTHRVVFGDDTEQVSVYPVPIGGDDPALNAIREQG